MEIWKDIEGYENKYQISNLGNVKSLETWTGDKYIKREKILKNMVYGNGYYYVCLSKNGKVKKYKVNRLVAQAFIPNPENKPFTNHIDGDKLNNNVDNLEWCTQSENMKHASKMGLRKYVSYRNR